MNMKKVLAMMLAVLMIVTATVAGTVAWLIDNTAPVVNTFTTSDVDIELTETTGENYKMIPGQPINKDPKVTVLADSEACWVFVKIEKTENYDSFMNGYTVAAGWTELETGVYYREVIDTDANQEFYVLDGNTLQVKTGVTKAMMDGLTGANYPKLTFTAYAIQKAGFDNAAAAWDEIN